MKIEDYSKYYIQGSDHYLIPKDEFKELFNEMVNWKEENQQLKDNWNKLKEYITEANEDLYWTNNYDDILHVMQELEQGSDSDDSNR